MDPLIKMELSFAAARTGTTGDVSTLLEASMIGLRLLVKKSPFAHTHTMLRTAPFSAPPNVHMFEYTMVTTPDDSVWMIGGRDDDEPINTFHFKCA